MPRERDDTMTAHIMLDPVGSVRREALETGKRMMRDKLACDFAIFATQHPDPVVSDELWAFVEHIRKQTIA
jgi:hypothetical protein